MTTCIKNRSRCASGREYTPSDSIGFWVASTRNGSATRPDRPADRHLALGHDLEQGGLDLGRSPVDLVGQHDVGEYRPPFDVELLLGRAPDPGADDVGRDQVGRELDAGEVAAHHPGQGRDREGLGQAGHALDEAVAPGQQADEGPLDHPVLADDHPLDLEQGVLEEGGVGGLLLVVGHRRRLWQAKLRQPWPRPENSLNRWVGVRQSRVLRSPVMAYDEDLASRLRELLAGQTGVTEKKMFGGLAFLINGNMAISASGQGGILVRADPSRTIPDGASLAVMRGRPMDGWLRVDAERLRTKRQLVRWTDMGTGYARSLPPKD